MRGCTRRQVLQGCNWSYEVLSSQVIHVLDRMSSEGLWVEHDGFVWLSIVAVERCASLTVINGFIADTDRIFCLVRQKRRKKQFYICSVENQHPSTDSISKK